MTLRHRSGLERGSPTLRRSGGACARVFGFILASALAAEAGTLDTVKSRGAMIFGVNSARPAFS
jgi:hypothetical protein